MSGEPVDYQTRFNFVAGFGNDATAGQSFLRACAELNYYPRVVDLDRGKPPREPPVVFIDPDDCRLGKRLQGALFDHHVAVALGVLAPGASIEPRLTRYFADIVNWPCSRQELVFRLQRACTAKPADRDDLTQELMWRCNLIGSSPVFLRAVDQLRRLAECDAHMLLSGETGTGKELAAQAVHYASGRREGPFVPVNCAAMPESLLENELFGHESGAYTDARTRRQGLVSLAEGGTLFLDEINALSLQSQGALLRFLQDGKYRSLGDDREKAADVRIVAATNSDLGERVAAGGFREDLRYRLEVLICDLPALRDRDGDPLVLARHFMRRFCVRYELGQKSLHPDFAAWIQSHDWPGNVRELENYVHRAVVMSADQRFVHVEHGEQPTESLAKQPCFKEAKDRVIREFEYNYLTELMRQAHGNVTRAARMARKERRSFGKLLKKHGIRFSEFS